MCRYFDRFSGLLCILSLYSCYMNRWWITSTSMWNKEERKKYSEFVIYRRLVLFDYCTSVNNYYMFYYVVMNEIRYIFLRQKSIMNILKINYKSTSCSKLFFWGGWVGVWIKSCLPCHGLIFWIIEESTSYEVNWKVLVKLFNWPKFILPQLNLIMLFGIVFPKHLEGGGVFNMNR